MCILLWLLCLNSPKFSFAICRRHCRGHYEFYDRVNCCFFISFFLRWTIEAIVIVGFVITLWVYVSFSLSILVCCLPVRRWLYGCVRWTKIKELERCLHYFKIIQNRKAKCFTNRWILCGPCTGKGKVKTKHTSEDQTTELQHRRNQATIRCSKKSNTHTNAHAVCLRLYLVCVSVCVYLYSWLWSYAPGMFDCQYSI